MSENIKCRGIVRFFNPKSNDYETMTIRDFNDEIEGKLWLESINQHITPTMTADLIMH